MRLLPESFWPTKLVDWLQVFLVYVVAMVVSIAGIWKWMKSPILMAIHTEKVDRAKADEQRDKLQRKVSDDVHNLMGRVTAIETAQGRADQDRAYMHETIGRIELSVDRIAVAQSTLDRERAKELATIREGVAKIMGKLDIDE